MTDEKFLFPVGDDTCLEFSEDKADIRAKILDLEKQLLLSDKSIHLEPIHYFSDGIYAREIFIPKGTLLTGHVHRTEHLNILSKGRITVLTEDGLKTLEAPHTMVSPPGTKRVGYTHEDSVWTTVHGTHERDLDKLEADLVDVSKSHSLSSIEKEKLQEAVCHGS